MLVFFIFQIRDNLSVTSDNQSSPAPPEIIPPLMIFSSWLFKVMSVEIVSESNRTLVKGPARATPCPPALELLLGLVHWEEVVNQADQFIGNWSLHWLLFVCCYRKAKILVFFSGEKFLVVLWLEPSTYGNAAWHFKRMVLYVSRLGIDNVIEGFHEQICSYNSVNHLGHAYFICWITESPHFKNPIVKRKKKFRTIIFHLRFFSRL
jgi:hypothetical protein